MSYRKDENQAISRRTFLKQMQWAPVLFLPSPVYGAFVHPPPPRFATNQSSFTLSDLRLTPHYPAKSPLDDILRLAEPGSDEYKTEGYAAELIALLETWSKELRQESLATETLANFLDPSLQFTSLIPVREFPLRPGDRIEVLRREFPSALLAGRERFVAEMRSYLAPLKRVETADFEIYECLLTGARGVLDVSVRYEIVGSRSDGSREQRIGSWQTRWLREDAGRPRILKWAATGETLSRASGQFFIDVTSHALGQTDSYRQQLLRGADYWRTVLDAAIGIDVYGNNGVAVGDFDGDGFDDLYVCQPAGLPNRLYRNRGDGTFEDVTAATGVGVLDFTACALFADFQNRGLQDLLVVCATGPLLFVNQGNGRFDLKRDAFRFAHPPQGSFTHAAAADYDRDGRLDLYFCLYSYYQGLDQYRYPVPYFDARNGPPNYLFHNEGDGFFQDRTAASRLNIENDRYSFACSWGDSTGDGLPDLYVVNDFGRNNLYRNNGDGTFAAVSQEAKVDEAGAGMSACRLDFDNDGKQDIYAAGMWVAAGMRVFGQPQFHGEYPENIRALYRRHMTGNSLYRNVGGGQFSNVANQAEVQMGRWSWSTDSWDFDHDGYPDLYVANGYVSGQGERDVSSFFWRQVVAKSPVDSSPSPAYERGWNAMNELIRSDSTWNGHERNVFFANNRDGTFSDVSAVVNLDFRDDSRAFSISDLDGDGRPEIVLKNRTAPQVRILRLAAEGIGNSITFRLRGTESNRDAIGTALTVESGALRQTKYVQAGSGFLSQHTKNLFFGLGKNLDPIRATIRWPGGLTQSFDGLPINHSIAIVEGQRKFVARPFSQPPQSWTKAGEHPDEDVLPSIVETWLIEPVRAPGFSLPDLTGNLTTLQSFQGNFVLLNLWTVKSSACIDQLRSLQRLASGLPSRGIRVAAINVDPESESQSLRTFAVKENLSFPVLLADPETTGIYAIVYRYLFDRHRDLALPASILIDPQTYIIKLYQGPIQPETVLQDARAAPRTAEERARKALPFPGTLVQDTFRRNDFTYGVAFFQHGFLDHAAESFRQVIAEKPDDAEAYYNLGTLFLRTNSLDEARQSLEKTVQLRPDYPEAWNNLGMLSAQQGDNNAAIRNFQHSLKLRPTYATALLNLGNLNRRLGNLDEAERLLQQGLNSEPDNPEVNYGLGMIYARKQEIERAVEYLERAIKLRPDYSDALNNLGVIFVQTKRYSDAEQQFRTCVQQSPSFDQAYLNLARLYIVLDDKDKARAVLESLLHQNPEHHVAQQMLQMLY